MKHLTPILEFIKVSDYKEWIKKADWNLYHEIAPFFKAWADKDKNANRIYIPIKISDQNQPGIPTDILDWLRWYGYGVIDMERAIVRDKDGRNIKLGKLLKKLGKEEMLNWFAKYRDGKLKKTDNLEIVISRHPYDILGMSTGRGWTSCHDINDKRYGGKHLSGLERSLNKCLVAYLIRKNDRNIENPVSRALIYKSYNSFSVSYEQYGTEVPEFRDELDKFAEKLNNRKI